MTDVWITSDSHFGHVNFLTFKDDKGVLIRGSLFSSVEEMNECMVERWNSVVKDGDRVYHLGDVYFGSGHEVLHRLKGKKRLILGNHDNGKDQKLQAIFGKIDVWRQFPEHNILFTHVPVHPTTLYKVKWNVHGHVHVQDVPDSRYFNACVEKTNYTPIHLEDLKKQLADRT